MSFKKFGRDESPAVSPITPSNVSGVSHLDKSKAEAFLGKGSKVTGALTFSGPVEIAGYVEGEITAQDRIVVGESAEVKARIVGAEVIIQGTVHGDIQASKKLSLKRPAKVFGNISSNNISIEEGVIFEGKCSMAINDSQGSAQTKASSNTKPGAAV